MNLSWKDFVFSIKKEAGANDPPASVSRNTHDGLGSTASYGASSFGGPLARRMPINGGGWKIWDSLRKINPLVMVDPKEMDRQVERERPDGSSDTYYHNILVGGANAGGRGVFGLSTLPFGVLLKGDNKELFRNGDISGIRAGIDKAISDKKNVRVWGHSWGGHDVVQLAKDYPNVQFIACDPVSWTGVPDRIPKNVTILRPDDKVPSDIFSALAQVVGHQWPLIEKGEGKTIVYHGNHVKGISDAIKRYNDDVRSERILKQRNANNGKTEQIDLRGAARNLTPYIMKMLRKEI